MANELYNKLYPAPDQWYRGNLADLTNSYSIHFFSEGFESMYEFDKAVVKVWKQLIEISPFNLIKTGQAILSAYCYWMDSVNTTNLGPVLVSDPSNAPTNRTTYNSYMWPKPPSEGTGYFINFEHQTFIDSIENTVVVERERAYTMSRVKRFENFCLMKSAIIQNQDFELVRFIQGKLI